MVQWGWIRCIHCEKFWCDFMARTWALIAPVQPVLYRVSCSNEIFPNTPKHYETHINMSLRSNGGGLGAFVAKNSKTTSWHKLVQQLHHFNPFCNEFRVVMKLCQMHPNTTRRRQTWFRVQWGRIGCVRCEKFWCDFMARTCALIAPVQLVLHWVWSSNEMIPIAPKHYETDKNMS